VNSTEIALPTTRIALPINPNTSGPAELQLLPGLGPKRAKAIIEFRNNHGCPAFSEPADLQAIHGIGPVTATRIGRYLSF
jgi:competence protein ComEA